MKFDINVFRVATVAGVTVAMIVGCSTPKIPITMDVAGEVSLTGVSKIALAGFNSIEGDPFAGVMAADAETCALVKRSVASAFYASPMYKIVDMDVEKSIFDAQGARPNKHYDAIVYGRLWWQFTPVAKGKYPHKFTLESWNNVPYTVKNPLTGKQEQLVAHVTSLRKDVIQMLDYQAQNATLMLSLSVYRIGADGEIDKVIDTYQVTNQGFTLMNGEMKLDCANVGLKDDSAVARLQATGKKDSSCTAYEAMFAQKSAGLADVGAAAAEAAAALTSGMTAGLGSGLLGSKKDDAAKKDEKKPAMKRKVDANGKLLLTQETVAMPTELQAKLMLASSITKSLSAKIAPSKATFEVAADLGDARLENLLKNGAFKSARDYAFYMLRQKLGKQICAKIAVNFLPEFGADCAYAVPDSQKVIEGYNEELIDVLMKADFNIYFYTLGLAHESAQTLEAAATYNDKMIDYLAGEDLDVYFYAIGICDEAMQNLENAEEYYRFAFNVRPTVDYALGISRAKLAQGQSGKRKAQERAQKKAAKKTNLVME